MKGGFDPIVIRPEDFKYTKDKERIIWTTNAYNVALFLLDVVKQIPWDKYTFNGISIVWEPNTDGEFILVQKNVKASYIKLSEKFIPYCLFGGSCYEILNNLYNLNLHDFVDPTGDIDIKINLPYYEIETKSEINHSYIFTSTDETELLPHINDLTGWILNQIELLVQNIPKNVFSNMIPCTEGEVLIELEGKVDIIKQIDNLWLLRSIGNSLLKIQLVCKFEGMQKPDHIMEYMFSYVYDVNNVDEPSGIRYKNNVNKGGFIIQTNEQLIQDNIYAMQPRKETYNTTNQHKWFNHVQRLKFLNNNIETLNIIIGNSVNIHNISELLMYIISQIKNLCIFSYTIPRRNLGDCYAKKALNDLIGNFLDIFTKDTRILDTRLIKRIAQKYGDYTKVSDIVDLVDQLIVTTNYGGKRKTKKFRVLL